MEVEVISKEHVKPSSPTPAHLRTYRLSLLDQLVPTAHIPMILFYDAPTAFSTDEALRRLKQSASQALPEFYPFAGKIKDDLYIDCNDDGVYYAEAKVNCSLSDVLACPDAKVIRKLLPDEPSLLESTSSDGDGIHVVMVQVNVFECGGIGLGAYLSHKIIDGPTCVTLLKAWSATARGSAGEVTPSFIAPSLFPQSESIPSDYMLGIWPALLKFGTCVTKRFVFDATAIAAIKSAAAHPSLVAHPTRIEAISAFIWGRCIAATEARRDGARRPSVLSHMINLRSKNKSSAVAALPEHTIGNLIWIVTARSEPESERNLQSLTSALRESLLKLNVNFFEGLVGEEAATRVCKCLEEMSEVYGDEEADYFGFSSLFNVGVYEADFGWGKPVWVSPGGINLPVYQNLVFLVETRGGDGIEAWVTLGEEDMAVLERDAQLLSYASVEPSPLEPRR